MHTPRWSFAGLLACALPSACAAPCVDDGLGQDNCPTQNDASATEGATESNTNTNTLSETMGSATMGSATMGMTGSQTADDTATETAGGTLWCVDADGDGYGDPDMCTQSDDMPPGTVDNDDDCDDTNPDTFPGAAPNDDRRACMKDADGDDWGDDDPPPGVDPGTDCDDDDPDAYPGVAENEDPADLCTVDADGDGWGDADPGGGGDGPGSGSDCYDNNPALNPDTVQLTAFLPYNAGPFASRTLQTVDASDATLGDFIQLGSTGGGIPNVNIVTGTFNEDAEIYTNDLTGVQLYTVDYAKTCGEGLGTITPVGDEPYGPLGDIVCGLEFGGNGLLYGIGHTGDDLRSFDRNTGEVADSTPLTLDGLLLDVVSCGMARDCTGDRLLFANGLDRTIYSVETNGEVEVVRDLSADIPSDWNPTGLEYDPITRTVLLSTGAELYRVDINDDTAPPELIGMFDEDISNLQYLPICM